MKREDITPELLARLVRFDGQALFWIEQTDDLLMVGWQRAAWNTKYAGKKCGLSVMTAGYQRIKFRHRYLPIHRVIWALQNGKWPQGHIDHINGDKLDNRIKNLRDVPRHINMRNQKRRTDNTSGMAGVTWSPVRRRWRASALVLGKRHCFGDHIALNEAIAARIEGQRALGFTDRHGR